jgi:hypothetical protein
MEEQLEVMGSILMLKHCIENQNISSHEDSGLPAGPLCLLVVYCVYLVNAIFEFEMAVADFKGISRFFPSAVKTIRQLSAPAQQLHFSTYTATMST